MSSYQSIQQLAEFATEIAHGVMSHHAGGTVRLMAVALLAAATNTVHSRNQGESDLKRKASYLRKKIVDLRQALKEADLSLQTMS